MKKQMETFVGFDHQKTPEECLHQIDAHMILNIREHFFNPVAYKQCHKKRHIYSAFCLELH